MMLKLVGFILPDDDATLATSVDKISAGEIDIDSQFVCLCVCVCVYMCVCMCVTCAHALGRSKYVWCVYLSLSLRDNGGYKVIRITW